jgi:hypothetical protein
VESGDRHPERASRYGEHVVETGRVEELDRLGVASVLAAHAELEVGLGLAAEPRRRAHELAHAALVDGLERVALQQALLEVRRHHPALDVVAAEAERHLGEVVGAEAEEVGDLGDLVGADGGTRRLDHGADRHVGLRFMPFRASSISAWTQLRASASSSRVTVSGIITSTIGFLPRSRSRGAAASSARTCMA